LNGSILVAGTAWGKVRKMMDHQSNILQEANPSDAIQIIGWKELPQAGQEFLQVSSDVIILFIKLILMSNFLYILKLLLFLLFLCRNVPGK
jgi:translation initiation factor IF-2